MPSVQTDIGRAFAAAEEAAGRPLNINTVKFAEVVFPDPVNPPAPPAALTDLEAIPAHTAPVTQVGKVDPDNVAYSVFLDTTVGDFTITQIGYYADDGGGGLVLMMVSNIPPVYKRANGPGQTGNNYRHTDIRQYAGAAAAADITMTADSWQQDVTALLAAKEDLANKGVANGYASLDAGGAVPDEQIPAGIQRTSEKGAANGYAGLDASGDVPDAQLPPGIQRTSEKGVANGYASLDAAGELAQNVDAAKITGSTLADARLSANVQFKSEKSAPNGYASLDTSGIVPDTELPSDLQRTGEKGVANGYASLGADGLVPGSQLPASSVGAGSIAQSHLKTAAGEVSTAGSSLVNLVLPGGEYGFYPRVGVTGGAPPHVFGEAKISDGQDLTSYAGQYFTNVALKAGSAQTNAIVRQRYIQASPPYDLGDGEVPLFVFATVNKQGQVISVYCAPDPPWANNGPTDIRPTHVKDGKSYQRRRKQAASDSLGKRLAACRKPRFEEVEVTPAFKNADMRLIPHPFPGHTPENGTVVLLDPVAGIQADLLALHTDGESICNLLHSDYLRLDNTALSRCCPPGVQAHAVTWRIT